MNPEGLRQKVFTFFTLNPRCVYSSVQLTLTTEERRRMWEESLILTQNSVFNRPVPTHPSDLIARGGPVVTSEICWLHVTLTRWLRGSHIALVFPNWAGHLDRPFRCAWAMSGCVCGISFLALVRPGIMNHLDLTSVDFHMLPNWVTIYTSTQWICFYAIINPFDQI